MPNGFHSILQKALSRAPYTPQYWLLGGRYFARRSVQCCVRAVALHRPRARSPGVTDALNIILCSNAGRSTNNVIRGGGNYQNTRLRRGDPLSRYEVVGGDQPTDALQTGFSCLATHNGLAPVHRIIITFCRAPCHAPPAPFFDCPLASPSQNR